MWVHFIRPFGLLKAIWSICGHFLYFTVIWSIYGHLVYFVAFGLFTSIWCILSPVGIFGVMYREKSGSPAALANVLYKFVKNSSFSSRLIRSRVTGGRKSG
jgi:hypothetical protein